MRRYLVIANALAGSADREALDAAVGALSAAGPTEVRLPAGPDDLDAAVAELGGRVPVVAGGDGSLHLVVNRLRRLGRLDQVTVGLLPLGTGNDFARAAGLPLDPLAAAGALATGRPHRFDLLEDDAGTVVVNAAHAGLGAEAAAAAASHKPRLGQLAYPLGALLAGFREGAGRCGSASTGPRTPPVSGCSWWVSPTGPRSVVAPRSAPWRGQMTAGWTS